MRRTGPVVDGLDLRIQAKETFRALAWWAILRSVDPAKKKDLERLTELRIEVQEILDRLAPGWDDVAEAESSAFSHNGNSRAEEGA